ncbi:MAG: DEAD/DEAH box helicase [Burkholderiales bacterium]|nr:DEAD/DEAH box helicase [Burkholderiales bacterium]
MTGLVLTRDLLEQELRKECIDRGRGYADRGRVLGLRHDRERDRFEASVRGTARKPYRVHVTLEQGADGVHIHGVCSCPVHANCKHVAAVLWRALNTQNEEEGGAPRKDGKQPGRRKVGERRGAQPRQKTAAASGPLPAHVNQWLKRAERLAPAEVVDSNSDVAQCLLYVLQVRPRAQGGAEIVVRAMTGRRLKAGGYGKPSPWTGALAALHEPPGFVTEEDLQILRLLLPSARDHTSGEFQLDAETGSIVLRALLATGRFHWNHTSSAALHEGPPRPGRAVWRYTINGAQRATFESEPPAEALLPLAPPWYIEPTSAECGPIEVGLSPTIAAWLADAPEIAAEHAVRVRDVLARSDRLHGAPLPEIPVQAETREAAPVPILRLYSFESVHGYGRGRYARGEFVDVAALRFEYAGVRTDRDSPGMMTVIRNGELLRLRRNHAAEKRAHTALAQAGFVRVNSRERNIPQQHKHDYTLEGEQTWLEFVTKGVANLRSQGWQVEFDESFRFTPVDTGEWHAEVIESGGDWFDLRLEIDIDGRRIDLLPVLINTLRQRPELLSESGNGGDPNESVLIRLDDGRILPVPLARVRPLVNVLHEMLDEDSSDTLRLSKLDVVRLADLESSVPLKWQGGDAMRALGKQLAQFKGLKPIQAPPGFDAQLRPYQEQGLAWLQFLREHGLGGILADDMGLGKTVQTLAHLLIEKQAGRLTKPALVIAPTSVIPNWKAEAARFAPQLSVHVSHGLKRRENFDEIGNSDLVLTTYALLPRDEATLTSHEFHVVILDEAQQIKNAQTRAARVVGDLKAQHRLCLTGTPLENHLGELWSLFHFLMPGLLGDAATFRRVYRTPIEKHADTARRDSLVRRIRPFLLRRTKDEVATDLPPKTEIIRTIELDGAQRELYETVRVAMDQRIRNEIATRGLAQSQIVVLDALLKLRQICCDPRLLKLDAAKQVQESAKLEALIEMLEELLPEGRRVLLFSQFTSMLELIEKELHTRQIPYVKLTGDTVDRAEPVRAFQAEEVPLFLISLKAGGTGLNLTAADTVIHYDPWWNPAVENQATARAHRIGQDKPVFVYKLLAAGSVEEKIAALQTSKAALAEGILGGDAAAAGPVSEEDIEALFQPLD